SVPCAVYTCVMPSFRPIRPSIAIRRSLQLDLDVDAGREIELAEGVDRLLRRLEDVEQAFVGADLELLARLLVDVRRAVHREALDVSGERNRAGDPPARPAHGLDDLADRLVEQPVIVRLQTDADLVVHAALFEDLGDDAGADGAPALADRETQALVHRDRRDEVDLQLDVVARHHHLRALGQRADAGHVGGAEVELRAVAVEERRVAAALLLREDVRLGLELRVRRDGARLREHLPALDLLPLDAPEKRADGGAPPSLA